jgi:hypothetical protein
VAGASAARNTAGGSVGDAVGVATGVTLAVLVGVAVRVGDGVGVRVAVGLSGDWKAPSAGVTRGTGPVGLPTRAGGSGVSEGVLLGVIGVGGEVGVGVRVAVGRGVLVKTRVAVCRKGAGARSPWKAYVLGMAFPGNAVKRQSTQAPHTNSTPFMRIFFIETVTFSRETRN